MGLGQAGRPFPSVPQLVFMHDFPDLHIWILSYGLPPFGYRNSRAPSQGRRDKLYNFKHKCSFPCSPVSVTYFSMYVTMKTFKKKYMKHLYLLRISSKQQLCRCKHIAQSTFQQKSTLFTVNPWVFSPSASTCKLDFYIDKHEKRRWCKNHTRPNAEGCQHFVYLSLKVWFPLPPTHTNTAKGVRLATTRSACFQCHCYNSLFFLHESDALQCFHCRLAVHSRRVKKRAEVKQKKELRDRASFDTSIRV